uniref:DNA repair protein XRCC1 n=1 Tax=Varanus komodoensis TaxID=61221 RepID=A0A8D2J748_VARKO
MPEIAIRHVVSASNSDTTHCAENLLKADTYRKWKAAQPGEKQVSVILQFEKEEQIYSIDIGNEGSAFVEVLAGSSASSSEQSYEVLLVTSSFMSPSESKGGTNLNRVRMFGPDKLVKATAERKWDRVKIVCTQPYTKSLAYGLSFVRFHSPPENNEVHSKTVTKLGLFKVKEEDSNSSSLKPGALFFSRVHKPLVSPSKASQNDQPSPSYAAASLQTSMSGSPDPSPSSVEKPTSKGAPKVKWAGWEAVCVHESPVCLFFMLPARLHAAEQASGPSPPQKMTVPKTSSSEVAANGSFQHLLDGTVFVLSGFQNPFRSELRHKALEMGGKYRPDWTPDSTHLICAFANTPKYSQVKGLGGIIVRKEWILDCYRTRRHLPCKRYLLARPESSSSEQEGESDEEASAQRHKPPAHPQVGESLGPLAASEPVAPGDRVISPGFRVEEEHRKKKQGGQATVPPPEDDPYGGSTDENTDVEEKEEADQPIPELPDLFGGKHFFLYGEFPSQERRLLNRYITAFSGEVEAYMNERVNFVVTAQQWDDTFEEALNENANLSFVRPRWIYNCNERQKLIPHQPYVVVPQV